MYSPKKLLYPTHVLPLFPGKEKSPPPPGKLKTLKYKTTTDVHTVKRRSRHLPARKTPSDTQFYTHPYLNLPPQTSYPKKQVSDIVNTPRFKERVPSPRPAPNRYYPQLRQTGPHHSIGHRPSRRCNEMVALSEDVWRVKTVRDEKEQPEVVRESEGIFESFGKEVIYFRRNPSSTFGVKFPDTSTDKRADNPSPQKYDISSAQKHIYKGSPTFTMGSKDVNFEPWISKDTRWVPGPGTYKPHLPAVKPTIPAFTFGKKQQQQQQQQQHHQTYSVSQRALGGVHHGNGPMASLSYVKRVH